MFVSILLSSALTVPAHATPSFPIVATGKFCDPYAYAAPYCSPTEWVLLADGTFSDNHTRSGVWGYDPATGNVGLDYDTNWWPGALTGTLHPSGCIDGVARQMPSATVDGTWSACVGPDSDGDGSPDLIDCLPSDPAIGGGVRVPADQPTIAAAAAVATVGQSICVDPGMYVGAVGVPRGGALYGTGGAAATTIVGDVNSTDGVVHGFTIEGDIRVNETGTVEDVVLPCGGITHYGWGWPAPLTVRASVIDACGGVGIYSDTESGVSIVDSTITHAHPAIFTTRTTYFRNHTSIWRSVLRDNQDVVISDWRGGSISIYDSQILGNDGTLFSTSYFSSDITVEGSDIVGNRCQSIYGSETDHDFNQSTISHHLSTGPALTMPWSCGSYSYPYYTWIPCFRYSHMGANASGDSGHFTAGVDGNVGGDPQFVRYSPALPTTHWDLHLLPTSPLRDAGDPSRLDPDGSVRDIGSLGWDVDYYADSDEDGMYDGWETSVGLGLGALPTADPDGDGLTNLQEMIEGSWPQIADSDGDGDNDAVEAAAGTDPHDPLNSDWSWLWISEVLQARLRCP